MHVQPLSLDLRERVVAAVSGGMSRRQAAERFGVSAASAVRWCALDRDTGSARAKPQGGDRHSHRVEAQADLILSLVDGTSDIALMEIQSRLAEQGHHFGIGTLWRFFRRHDITWKRDCARQRAGPPGHPEAARRVVRRAARSRPGAPRLHRRDVGLDQHGAPLRKGPAGRTASRRR